MLTRKQGSSSGCRLLTVGYSQWNNNSFCMGGRCHEISFSYVPLKPRIPALSMLLHVPSCPKQPQHVDLPGGLQMVWGGAHGCAVASRAGGCCWQEPVP